jgi:Ca-activated chloride channel homolog
VEHLGPRDLVGIVQYGADARLVLEHTAAARKPEILAAIEALQCEGGTNLEKGMDHAYRVAARAFVGGAENKVLLLSDGVATLGTDSAAEILKQVEQYRRQGITCSVFGFGAGTYDDVMLEALANKGDGMYRFIDSESAAKEVFADDLAATMNTIAADVKIQVEFMPDRVARYRQLGYENRKLTREEFRNDAVDAGEVGSGQSVTALYELELQPRRPAPESGVLAVVRVRYRRVEDGRVQEIEQPVTIRDIVHSFDQAPGRFRLAACAAEFAEILRGSPFAAGSNFQDVAQALRPVALELNLDGRVAELLRLVEGAGGMGRAE